MRFSDLCEKEVVNVKDCRCLGSVRDLDIDKECGRILALIVPGPGKYLGCFSLKRKISGLSQFFWNNSLK